MRQITRDSAQALQGNYTFKRGNTEVTADRELKLHGNTIARFNNNQLEISDAGWKTVTTKERLNGILELINAPKIYQKDFTWYYDRKDDERRSFEQDKQQNGFISVAYMLH